MMFMLMLPGTSHLLPEFQIMVKNKSRAQSEDHCGKNNIACPHIEKG